VRAVHVFEAGDRGARGIRVRRVKRRFVRVETALCACRAGR